MKLSIIALVGLAWATTAATAAALDRPPTTLPKTDNWHKSSNCLTTDQANFLIDTWASYATNPNRTEAVDIARTILADIYSESSGSIDSLLQLSNVSFPQTNFLASLASQPALPSVATLKIIPAYPYLIWYHVFKDIGTMTEAVKSIGFFTVSSDCQRLLAYNYELDSLAWAIDSGLVTSRSTITG